MNAMSWRHALLALAVVAVWGTNFAVIKSALAHFPPFTFATLRFVFAFLPAWADRKAAAQPPLSIWRPRATARASAAMSLVTTEPEPT